MIISHKELPANLHEQVSVRWPA